MSALATIDPPFASMRDRLRSQTRGLHEAAEAAIDIDHWLVSKDLYCGYLRTLWSIHAGYENAWSAFSWADTGLDPAQRQRSQFILSDLACLDRQPPVDPLVITLDSVAAAIGSLYVIEGSTLGNRVVLERAKVRLGVEPASGARFLTGYGPATGARWRETINAINRTGPAGPTADAIETGARATFQTFISAYKSGAIPWQV